MRTSCIDNAPSCLAKEALAHVIIGVPCCDLESISRLCLETVGVVRSPREKEGTRTVQTVVSGSGIGSLRNSEVHRNTVEPHYSQCLVMN